MTEPSGFYTHYKRPDRYYFVLSCGANRTEDDKRRMVNYMALYDDPEVDRFHFRTIEEWNDPAWIVDDSEDGLVAAGHHVPRFQKIDNPPAEIRALVLKHLGDITKLALTA